MKTLLPLLLILTSCSNYTTVIIRYTDHKTERIRIYDPKADTVCFELTEDALYYGDYRIANDVRSYRIKNLQ